MQLPAIDQNICGAWTELDTNLYNKLQYYLVEAQGLYRQHWAVWAKLLDSISWKPGNGDTMRRVGTEPMPMLRQEAYPERINTAAKVDIVTIRERRQDARVHWQKFISPNFNFLPDFQDFMKHIDDNMDALNKQTTYFEDSFYRTRLFQHAPYVYVCGVGLVPAPTADGKADGSTGKTWAWQSAECYQPLMGLQGSGAGYLTFEELFKMQNAAENTVGMTPFEGTGKPSGDSAPLNERFAIVQSPESWNNFVNDPWLKENRPINMNIVTDAFRGDIWGRIRSRQERFPFRPRLDGSLNVIDIPAPETVEEDPDREDFNRTKPNRLYTTISNCPIEWGFFVGGKAADIINVGPPPGAFTKETNGGGINMNWNGKAYLTKDFLVPCRDQNGNMQLDMNSWGEYLRAQAALTVGISPYNSFNILPFCYKRRVGVSTTTQS